MFPPNNWLVATVALLLAPIVPATSLRQSSSSEAPKKAEGTPPETTVQSSSGMRANGSGVPQSDFSQEPVVYEYRHTLMRYENDGEGYWETQGRVHIQTSAGLRIGEFTIFYNAENESAEIIRLHVIKPDGSVITAGPSDVQDLSAPLAQGAPMYTDAREKVLTVPGLSVGDYLEYDVKITSKPVLAGQFWHTWDLKIDAICLDESVELNVPRDRALKLKAPPDMTAKVEEGAGRRIYRWSTSNLKVPNLKDLLKTSKVDAKLLLEGLPTFPPRQIVFSTFQSWKEVGDWYAELERDRRIPSAAVRAKADEIVQGRTTGAEKAQALYDWVSNNIRYVSLSFGIGRYQPHSASDVLANRYGDCKDKTTLLEAFLSAEGITAQAVLINSVTDVDQDVPTPLQFNHVITYAPIDGNDAWLDSTVGVAPFGYLFPRLRGKNGLVVFTKSAPAFRQTPKELPMPTATRVEVQGKADLRGSLSAEATLIARGDLEVFFRLLNAHYSPAQVSAFVEQSVLRPSGIFYGDTRFTNFKLDNPDDLDNPVRVEFHVEGYLTYVDLTGISPAEVVASLTHAYFQNNGVFLHLPKVGADTQGADTSQVTPIRLGGPREYSLSAVLTVPTVRSDKAQQIPDVYISDQYAEYDSTANWEGQLLRANWHLNLRAAEIPASDAQKFSAFRAKFLAETSAKKVVASLNSKSSEVKTTSSASATSSTSAPVRRPGDSSEKEAHAPAADVEDLFHRGLDEAKNKDYASAEQSFGAALKADLEYADAWRELGKVYMYSRNYSDAERAFRRYLELEPDERLAYVEMAWVLYDEKKFDEDVRLLEKRTSDVPDDGSAQARLGLAYLAQHRADQAVPALERATSLLPHYAAAYFNLGRAYLETHQGEKAVASFQQAISVDGGDNMLNNAAYQLAEHGLSLEIAEQWAKRAVSSVEIELNYVTLKTITSNTSTLVEKAATHWDTLGWIKFQEADYSSAEKYCGAAWQLTDDTTIGSHLGRIYIDQGRKKEAIEIFALTLATVPTNRDLDDDEQEARRELLSLLGTTTAVDDRVKEDRARRTNQRAVSVPNAAALQGIAQYRVMIGPGWTVADIEPLGTDDPLANLVVEVRGAKLPQSFPDATITRLPRVGTLACANPQQPCTFTLLTTESVSRLILPD